MKHPVNFIGLGAPKCGTTWIAECLEQHPDILFSNQKSVKELNFFNTPTWRKAIDYDISNYHKGIFWYLNQFPKEQEGKIRGEFSTSYLSDPKAPRRIVRHFPDAKLLVALRDPVEMVYSMHNFTLRTLRASVPSDFFKAIEKGYYLEIGLYAKHLERYLDLFDRKQFHIIFLKDIVNNSRDVVRNLYEFLGVSSDFIPNHLNRKSNPRTGVRFKFLNKLGRDALQVVKSVNYDLYNWLCQRQVLYRFYETLNTRAASNSEMSSEVRAHLRDFYREDIQRLRSLLGRPLVDWA